MLDIDPDGLKRVADTLRTAGHTLSADLGSDAAPCGNDEVSTTIMGNLNARRRWLVEHVRAGGGQAFNAADGVEVTTAGYVHQDQDLASNFGGGGTTGGSPGAPSGSPSAAPAPGPMPTASAIPDISGQDGEQIAAAMELGAGPGPALAAAALCATLATQAAAAAEHLEASQGQLLAAGQSQASDGLMPRLIQAASWSTQVATHAGELSSGYSDAAAAHGATLATVGPSAGWKLLKTSLQEAINENQATAGLAQPRVDALSDMLTTRQQETSGAVQGYQSTGQTVSGPAAAPPPPGGPNLDPNASPDGTNDGHKGKKKHSGDKNQQDMLSSLMGAAGPVMQSLGKANPLQSVGQMAQEIGQLGSQLGKGGGAGKGLHPSSPIKPAALHPSHLGGGGKGAGGKGLGGGGIKGGAGINGAVHPASAVPSTPAKPVADASKIPAEGRGARGGGAGAGMMPMGGRGSGGTKPAFVKDKYPEEQKPQIEGTGRAGVVADTTPNRPAPVVNPETTKKSRDRISQRKKDIAGQGEQT